jgi:hypothetical protein
VNICIHPVCVDTDTIQLWVIEAVFSVCASCLLPLGTDLVFTPYSTSVHFSYIFHVAIILFEDLIVNYSTQYLAKFIRKYMANFSTQRAFTVKFNYILYLPIHFSIHVLLFYIFVYQR